MLISVYFLPQNYQKSYLQFLRFLVLQDSVCSLGVSGYLPLNWEQQHALRPLYSQLALELNYY